MRVIFIPKDQEQIQQVSDYLGKIGREDIIVEDKNSYVPKDGDMVEYDVEPPQPKIVIDHGGNAIRFGDFQEEYHPYEEDLTSEDKKNHLDNYSLKHAGLLFKEENLVKPSQESIDTVIKKIREDTNGIKLSELGIFSLLDLWEIEEDYFELNLIYMAFIHNAYCEMMDDKWGSKRMGYRYMKYNVESGTQDVKDVVGFYTGKTADWISEDNLKLLELYPESKRQNIKALKSRMETLANMKPWMSCHKGIITTSQLDELNPKITKSVFQIKFFGEFLMDKIETKMKEQNGMREFNGVESSDNTIEISEDDIPF